MGAIHGRGYYDRIWGKGDRHITAEMLYEEATKARLPVSLATVYNTLHQFTDVGLLRQLAIDGSKTYFDTNGSPHHPTWPPIGTWPPIEVVG